MEKEKKNEYYKLYKVITFRGSWSEEAKCNIKNCKKHQKYMIFVGNDTKLSTLNLTVCGKHLELGINKSLDLAKELAEKGIAAAEKREIEKAKQLLKLS